MPSIQDMFIEDINNIVKTGKPVVRKQYGTVKRCTYKWLAMPISCSPCFLWSTIWRVIVCPVQCCAKGSEFACSNNGCTDPSDNCISKCFSVADANIEPNILIMNDTTVDHNMVLSIIKNNVSDFSISVYNKYSLYDYVKQYVEKQLDTVTYSLEDMRIKLLNSSPC